NSNDNNFKSCISKLYTFDIDNQHIAFIWEVATYFHDYATYVFISPLDKSEEQLLRIWDSVTKNMNFRTFLRIDNKDQSKKDAQINGRRYWGYAGSVRKNRGNENAFESWRMRLEKLIAKNLNNEISDDFDLESIVFQGGIPIITRGTVKPVQEPIEIEEQQTPVEFIQNFDNSDKLMENILNNLENGFLKNLNYE
ncbi:MAG: hypothetical protein ACKOZV_06475, partial [Bacteroidota bacterium]